MLQVMDKILTICLHLFCVTGYDTHILLGFYVIGYDARSLPAFVFCVAR